MKQNILLLAGWCVLLALPACNNTTESEEAASADTEEVAETYIDPVVAASEYYTLLSEEGPVRVIEMKLPAGARDNLHSHRHETVYFVQGGKVKIHVGDEVMDAEIPDGHVMHHAPWTHSVENVGETTVHAIIFELTEPGEIAAMEGYIDATEAASDHYSLLSSEGGVRVVHMKLGPGETDQQHSHYQETVYFITGGKANIHVGEEVVEADIPDGHVMHHAPWTHSVSNVGETTIEALIFEQVPASGGD
ncbi:MAG: hypothetical protein R3301_14010 [Saprospiraceae bacterium]|nr:hypothetical protein [Saprospiraceae bacterium]